MQLAVMLRRFVSSDANPANGRGDVGMMWPTTCIENAEGVCAFNAARQIDNRCTNELPQ
tara:strand:+ start:830 stop:1006 length:177 start_codon:yes stop_codon:yes gene_type:complete